MVRLRAVARVVACCFKRMRGFEDGMATARGWQIAKALAPAHQGNGAECMPDRQAMHFAPCAILAERLRGNGQGRKQRCNKHFLAQASQVLDGEFIEAAAGIKNMVLFLS